MPLKFETQLDDSAFVKGLKNMASEAEGLNNKLKDGMASGAKSFGVLAAGAAAGAAAIFTVVKSSIDFASSMSDSIDSTDLQSESFQRLSHAFNQSGVEQEKFVVGAQTLQASLAKARDGDAAAIKSFADLGISTDDFGKTTEEVMYLVADANKYADDQGKALVATLALLGKSGKAMVAGLKEGSDGLKQLGSEAQVLADEERKRLDAAGDSWNTLTRNIQGYIAAKVAANMQIFSGDDNLTIAKAARPADEADMVNARADHAANKQKQKDQEKRQRDAAAQMALAAKNVSDAKEFEKEEANIFKERIDANDALHKQRMADEKSLEEANRAYALMESRTQIDANVQQGELRMKQIAKEHEATMHNMRAQAADKEKQLAYEQSFVESNQEALNRDTGNAVRRGLMNPQDRRAEDRAAKREAREERRVRNIDELAEANPEKRIRGTRRGDSENAKRIREDRNNLIESKNKVAFTKESIKELVDAIEKLIVKP